MRYFLLSILFCISLIAQSNNISKTNLDNSIIIEEEFDDDFADDFEQEFKKEHKKEIFDPLSGYNRVMTSFNDTVFTYALNPLATGYSKILNEDIRIGISNFLDNLLFPVRFVNNILQFKLKSAGEETGRFIINTIWGLGGFLDPAKEYFHLEEKDEDFGQTLGYWGVGEGFPIVLPFLGPSNLRDIVGRIGDFYVSPLSKTANGDLKYKIPKNFLQSVGISAMDITNTTSLRLGQYENIKKDALDLYPLLRDIYSQHRKEQIKE